VSAVRLRSAVAVLVTAAAGGLGCLVTPAPSAVSASAAACPGSTGVTVVVEYGALGSGTSTGCAAEGGGQTADRLLKETGHALTYVQRFPGFVCRIDGLPADDPCVNTPPADAYWGLWWSDGETGEWSYSSLGAGSLAIPAGGYLAMVWDGSTGTVRPQTDPAPHPTPTPTPTKKPSPTPTATLTSRPSATPSASSSPAGPSEPTAAPSKTKKPRPTPSPSETTSAPTSEPPADEQTEAAGVAEDPVDPSESTQSSEAGDDGGLPVWVAPVVVVVLLGAAGGVAVVRRTQQP